MSFNINNSSFSFFSVLVFLKFFFFNFNILEFYSKTNQNENFSELLFFYWTNSWLNSLFFFLICAAIFNFIYFLIWFTPLFSPLFVLTIYANEISSFFLDNYCSQFHNSYAHNLVFLLLNDLNKIHPPILYTGAAIFLFLWFYNQFLLFRFCLFSKSFFFKIRTNFNWFVFYFSTIAILLGSWWAQQEESWNGWWNWDSSEVISLLLLIFSLLVTHVKFTSTSRTSSYWTLVFTAWLTVTSYFLVQLNFEQTNHNFGLKFFFFFNNFYFLILLYLVSFFLIFSVNGKKKYLFNCVFFFFKVFKSKILEFYQIYWMSFVSVKIFLISFVMTLDFNLQLFHIFAILGENFWFFNENLFNQYFTLFLCFKIWVYNFLMFLLHSTTVLMFLLFSFNSVFEFFLSQNECIQVLQNNFNVEAFLVNTGATSRSRFNFPSAHQLLHFFFSDSPEEVKYFLTTDGWGFFNFSAHAGFCNIYEVNFVFELFADIIFLLIVLNFWL